MIQFKYGVKAFSGWIKLKFWQLTLLCFLSEFILAVVLFYVVLYAESVLQSSDYVSKCGMGYAGVVVLALPISFLILMVSLIQYVSLKNNP